MPKIGRKSEAKINDQFETHTDTYSLITQEGEHTCTSGANDCIRNKVATRHTHQDTLVNQLLT